MSSKGPRCPNRNGFDSPIFKGSKMGVHKNDHLVTAFGKTPGGRIILECHECWHMWYSNSKSAHALYAEKIQEGERTQRIITSDFEL